MSIFARYLDIVRAAVAALSDEGVLPPGLPVDRIGVEPPRDPAHGDIATNAAMVLAGAAKMPPRALAERLISRLGTALVVGGVGFALTVASDLWVLLAGIVAVRQALDFTTLRAIGTFGLSYLLLWLAFEGFLLELTRLPF